MADLTIQVPPPTGGISISVDQTLEINAEKECNFCCTIGANFSPSIANILLTKGLNGPFTATTVGSGMYNASPNKDTACTTASPVLNAQSIQINP